MGEGRTRSQGRGRAGAIGRRGLRGALLAAAAVASIPAVAKAHAIFTDPEPRSASVTPGPCGNATPTGGRTVFAPGEEITVRWTTQISHEGIYRVRFSPNDDVGFEAYELHAVEDDPAIAAYAETVTLPECACTDCTLQLFQALPAGSDGYYSCADIELRPTDPASVPPCPTIEVEDPPPDPGDGGSTGGEDTGPDVGDDAGAGESAGGDGSTGDGAFDPTFTGGDASPTGDDAPEGDADREGGAGCSVGARPSGALLSLVLLPLVERRHRSSLRG